MKVVILAGGLGSRLSEETVLRPKPMVEIGGKPILLHVMGVYAAQGFTEFVIALGYKGEQIKEFFVNYRLHSSDLTVDLGRGHVTTHGEPASDWLVHLVDTGHATQTGGRVRRLRSWLGDSTFMLTYGDGLANVDINALLAFHRSHGRLATVTAVRPPSRFGGLTFDGDRVTNFSEKPQTGEGWINGGFFVFEPGVLDYIAGDLMLLEREPLERLAEEGELMAYRHEGFFQPMDTIREKQILEGLWQTGEAPWVVRL